MKCLVYGKGVYFARLASLSHRYTDIGTLGCRQVKETKTEAHLFICKVLVGNFKKGDRNTETKNLPSLDKNPVDSTVDSEDDPNIFVIYKDAQAYPEYLITYNQNQ